MSMSRTTIGLACVFVCGLLSGCAAKNDRPNAVRSAAPDPLVEAASSVSAAMRELAAVEQTRTPSTPSAAEPSDERLKQPMTVTWTGPLEPFVRMVGEAAHYKVSVLGKPASAQAVVLDIHRTAPIYRLLEEAGIQAGVRANILVKPRSQVIEVRYEAR